MVLWIKRIICILGIVWVSAMLVVLTTFVLLPIAGIHVDKANIFARAMVFVAPIVGVWLYVRGWRKVDVSQPPPVPKRSERSIGSGLIWVIVIVVGVPFAYFSVKDSLRGRARQQQPGYAEFRSADMLLMGRSRGGTHGNTPEAEALAAEFSVRLKQARNLGVESRKSSAIISLTGGEFLTYCLLTKDSCVFMVHVPDLRNFSKEAKDFMADAAWVTALAATEQRKATLQKVVVGIRGVLLYDRVISGRAGSPQDSASLRVGEIDDSTECQSFLQGFFAPSAPTSSTVAQPPGVQPSSK